MIMREIKFRGQTRKLGEKVNLKGEPVPSNWVYGGIFQGVERSVVYDGETYEKHTVYNETVGQYTGLKNKNGREIYEGDILEFKRNVRVGTRRSRIGRSRSFSSHAEYKEMDIRGVVKIGEYQGVLCSYIEVEKTVPYEHYFFGEGKASDRPSVAINNLSETLKVDGGYEIIGNIHDNPELLGDSN